MLGVVLGRIFLSLTRGVPVNAPLAQGTRMEIEEHIKGVKERPSRGLLILGLCVMCFLAGNFFNGYFGELGRRCAEKKEHPKEVKQELSHLLQQISPQILVAARQGDAEMPIWINQIHLAQLRSLSREPTFSDYLSVQALDCSGNTVQGNSPDGAPMDRANKGQLTKCILTFGDGLRR